MKLVQIQKVQTEREALLRELTAAAARLPVVEPNLRDVVARIPNVLGTTGIPALVPYLLPYPNETLSLERVLRILGVGADRASAFEAVRRTAASALVQLLSVVHSRDLPLLDQRLRLNYYSFRRYGDPWNRLQPADLDALPGTAAEQLALLAVLMSHHSGFVREAATTRLFRRGPEYAFPFLLVRANDWVEQVQTTALRLFFEFLKPGRERTVARALPLIQRFHEYGRRDHAPLLLAVRNHLSTPDGIAALTALMAERDVSARRAVTQFVNDATVDSQLPFIRLAALDRDAVIRSWSARRLETVEKLDVELAGQLRDQMWLDSSSAIRLQALYSFVRGDRSLALAKLSERLLDRSAAVRHAARFYLKQLDAHLDVAAFYRDAVTGDTAALAAAVAGLGEVGVAEDVGLLLRATTHESSRVVRAVLVALSRLDLEGTHERRLALLVDARPGVARQAASLLPGRLDQTDLARLLALVDRVGASHAAANLAHAAVRLPLWIDLQALLHLAASGNEMVRAAAFSVLADWRPVGQPGYAVPPPNAEVMATLSRCREAARPMLPLPTAVSLARTLAQFR